MVFSKSAAASRGRVWSTLGGLAVFALWLVSAAANYQAGVSLSHIPETQEVLGAASVAIDVLKAILLFVVVAAWRNDRYAILALALIVFALSSIWSGRAATSFAFEALTAPITKAEDDKAKLAALSEVTALKRTRASFLAQQKTTAIKATHRAAEGAAAANSEAAKEFTALIQDLERSAKTAAAPPQENPLAWFRVDPKTGALILAVFFGLLLEIVSSTGFWMLSESRRAKVVALKAEPVPEPVLGPPPLPPAALPEPMPEVVPEPLPVREKRVILPLKTKITRPAAAQALTSRRLLTSSKLRANDGDMKQLVRQATEGAYEKSTAQDRIRLSTIVSELNKRLPKDKRITSSIATAHHITPTLIDMGFSREVTGNRTYVRGIRPRAAMAA